MAKALKSANISAATLKQHGLPDQFVQDYMNFAKNMAIISTQFQAHNNEDQTFASEDKMLFPSVDRNVGGTGYAASILTIVSTGDYVLDCCVSIDDASNLNYRMYPQRSADNGATWATILPSNGSSSSISGFQFDASKNDRIRVTLAPVGMTSTTTKSARISLRRVS